MTFAEKLLQLRKREGYSQEELANILGVSLEGGIPFSLPKSVLYTTFGNEN